jgi:N-acetyl-anhydromuramyl-L-alanine amidase AmpD
LGGLALWSAYAFVGFVGLSLRKVFMLLDSTSPPSVPQSLVLPLPFKSQRTKKIEAVILHCLGYPTPRLCLWNLFLCKVSAHFLVLQMNYSDFLAHIQSPLSSAEASVFSRMGSQGKEWWAETKARVRAWRPQGQEDLGNDGPLVIELVDPSLNAWHAGVSTFGRLAVVGRSLNQCSIGIEMHLPGYDAYTWGQASAAQQETVAGLVGFLCNKWQIDKRVVLAHSSIAPNRRTDPGLGFSWAHLAKKGFGYQPPVPNFPHDIFSHRAVPAGVWDECKQGQWVARAQALLASIGFDCPQTGHWDLQSQYCLNAYRLQFYPRGAIARVRLADERTLGRALPKPDPSTITPGVLWAMTAQSQDPTYPDILRKKVTV